MPFEPGRIKTGGVQKGFKRPDVAIADIIAFYGVDEIALNTLVEMVEKFKTTKPQIAIKAAELVLAYRYGRPKESIEHSGVVNTKELTIQWMEMLQSKNGHNQGLMTLPTGQTLTCSIPTKELS